MDILDDPNTKTNERAGWRPEEWARAVGVSRSMAYQLAQRGEVQSVHIGRVRVITTPPSAFLAGRTARPAA